MKTFGRAIKLFFRILMILLIIFIVCCIAYFGWEILKDLNESRMEALGTAVKTVKGFGR